MADLNTFFNEEEINRINNTVSEAEKKTSAEIVPVLTDASGGYDRAEDTFGLLLSIAGVIVIWLLFQGIDQKAAWTTQGNPLLKYNLLYVIITITAAFIIGALVASKVWFIRHLFASRSLMKDNVRRGAHRAFYEFSLSKTEEATGVVIYISLFEKRVYVLGDENIKEKLTDNDFAQVKNTIIKGFRNKTTRTEGLCEAISLCGVKLSDSFPAKEGDVNELPNTLRIWEQNL